MSRSADYLTHLCLKKLTCSFDLETVAQIKALQVRWGEGQSEVLRSLVEIGLECLDGEDKKAIDKASVAFHNGDV